MTRLFAVCASFAVVLCLYAQVRAGTLPDISGTWYANGSRSSRCQISQSGLSVSLTNERGNTATGRFTDPGTLSTDWGVFNGGKITGKISNDLRTITWSNGTYWSRPTPSPLQPTLAPATPTPTPKPTPEPLRVSVQPIERNQTNPLYVYRASFTNGYIPFTTRQCVSYRNVTTKVVTAATFHFVVTNRRGGIEQQSRWSDKGTFTPPVNIDDHCFGGSLPAPHIVRAMAYETIALTQVVFADGTTWEPGASYLRGYTVSGEPLPKPTLQTTAAETEGAPSRESANDLVTSVPYRLRTQFTGAGACLDVVNDGLDNRLSMAACGDYSGQRWWGESAGQGQARLKNRFTGAEKCLDVVNDGSNDRLTMADCGNSTGQMWWSEEAAQGRMRLKNAFTGSAMCLDIVNDGRNNRLRMAECGDRSGQRWSIGR